MSVHKKNKLLFIIFFCIWCHFWIDLFLRNVVVTEPPPTYTSTTGFYDSRFMQRPLSNKDNILLLSFNDKYMLLLSLSGNCNNDKYNILLQSFSNKYTFLLLPFSNKYNILMPFY